MRSIETLRKRSTLIVVAHKLETIQMADEIIVLNKEGHIAEVGSHEKLLAKNGAYKEFWDKRNASSQWKLEKLFNKIEITGHRAISLCPVISVIIAWGDLFSC